MLIYLSRMFFCLPHGWLLLIPPVLNVTFNVRETFSQTHYLKGCPLVPFFLCIWINLFMGLKVVRKFFTDFRECSPILTRQTS